MKPETKRGMAEVTMGLLVGWTSMCFFIGMAVLFSAKSSLNFDYIFTVLLTGLLSGMLAILAYLSWRICEK